MSLFRTIVSGDQMLEGIYNRMMHQVILYVDSKHKTSEVTEDSVLHDKVQSTYTLEKLVDYLGSGTSASEKVAKKIKEYIKDYHKINKKNTSTETM